MDSDQAVRAALGAGFFIGDGAGVGKGRQIAGIILDSYARGRRRAVWLSTSTVRPQQAPRSSHTSLALMYRKSYEAIKSSIMYQSCPCHGIALCP